MGLEITKQYELNQYEMYNHKLKIKFWAHWKDIIENEETVCIGTLDELMKAIDNYLNISGVTGLQQQIDNLENWAENHEDGMVHDGRYYREDEIDDMLSGLGGSSSPALIVSHDKILYTYTNDQSLTLLAGGSCGTSDGEEVIILESDLDVTLTDLASGENLSEGFWYIWIGKNSADALIARLSTSATTLPTEMMRGRKLRAGLSIYDDGTKKIRAFDFDGKYYLFHAPITLLMGTTPTSSTFLDLAAYVPLDVRAARLHITQTSFEYKSSPAMLRWSFDNSTWVFTAYGDVYNAYLSQTIPLGSFSSSNPSAELL